MADCYVYVLSDNTGIRYIGVSVNPLDRIKNHIYESKNENNKCYNLRKSRWLRSIDFNFRSRIIFSGTEQECYQKEIELISLAKSKGINLVNTSEGGDKPPRISDLSNFAEIKNKIKAKAKGRIPSEETRKKMSIAHKAISNKLKACSGYENPRARPVAQLDKDGKIVFIWACATEAVDALGLSRTSVSSVCGGYQKTAGGYRFTYF
jgi:predicted GIY-YIG superfamily endonuclease